MAEDDVDMNFDLTAKKKKKKKKTAFDPDGGEGGEVSHISMYFTITSFTKICSCSNFQWNKILKL